MRAVGAIVHESIGMTLCTAYSVVWVWQKVSESPRPTTTYLPARWRKTPPMPSPGAMDGSTPWGGRWRSLSEPLPLPPSDFCGSVVALYLWKLTEI